ncbi:MAG: hypothetical protein GTO53_10510 [Planctomycetales bacterium]|nr:hypothetical protein [Planctomycetales bacterium]NIM09553.1 hypothetical protein [Planctomycetales bacterium]NIN09041.1 hypothetical protein [Planctomycetales bacterium]NIN78154.1 hypothetical protein [Planctomycetales bacterium]NIO35339.1 hypothetical protein [Planctomycetales bacterium]
MARKTVSIKGKRAEADAAAKPKKKKKKAVASTTKTKRKSRKKVAPEVRLKAFWGVFNQSLKRVALYEYSQRRQADKKAEELQEKQTSPHFVQLVKEVIQEE